MADRIVPLTDRDAPGWVRSQSRVIVGYLRRNPSLPIGLALLLLLALFAGAGRLFVDVSTAAPLSAPPTTLPSEQFPLGTDPQGRNLIAVLIEGTWLTLRTGMIAG